MSGDPLTGLTSESSGDALSSFGIEDVRTDHAGAASLRADISAAEVRRAAPLRFVDAVALVQAICDASVRDRGPLGGLPELTGVFLTSSGDVAIEGPFSSGAPARQAARLLHELVSPEQTPPAARLFIGRWTNSDAPTLTDFTPELTYFARPNGRELIAALYARGAGSASAPPPALPLASARTIVEQPEPRKSEVEPARRRAQEIVAWLQAHRKQVIGAAAVTAAFMAAGLTVWMWPSTAAAGRMQSAAVATPGTDIDQPDGTGDRIAPAAATTGRSNRSRIVRTPAAALPDATNAPVEVKMPPAPLPADIPPVQAPPQALPVEAPAQTSRPARVYTAADADVEPPVLRSSEIPEWLITGFDVRKNSVELLISADGDVQRARMLGAPQRLPDVMLLSRVKEWSFAPATRAGVPVPYRLVLSWNVTP